MTDVNFRKALSLKGGNHTTLRNGWRESVLRFSRAANSFKPMSTKAEAILEQFKGLPRDEQWAVYEAVARSVVPQEYGPLSDEELVAAAAQTFALLDQEEARAESR